MKKEYTLEEYLKAAAKWGCRRFHAFREFNKAELEVIEEVLSDVEYYQSAEKQVIRTNLLEGVRAEIQKRDPKNWKIGRLHMTTLKSNR